MFCGRQISFRRFQGPSATTVARELCGFRFYNREVSASAPLEQKEGEATSGGNPPPVLKTVMPSVWFYLSVCERSPELGLAFAVSARFSPPRGGKLPPASARCGSDECLLGLSFCSRRTMRWGKAISIPAARSAAFTATATSLCTNGDCETSSVVKPSTKTSASSPNCFSTASGGGSFVTCGFAAAVFRSNAITCSGSLP